MNHPPLKLTRFNEFNIFNNLLEVRSKKARGKNQVARGKSKEASWF